METSTWSQAAGARSRGGGQGSGKEVFLPVFESLAAECRAAGTGLLCGMRGESGCCGMASLLPAEAGASVLTNKSPSGSLSGRRLLPPFSLLWALSAFPARLFLTRFGTGGVQSGTGGALHTCPCPPQSLSDSAVAYGSGHLPGCWWGQR